MTRNTVHFHAQIYKNVLMTVDEARLWLNATPIGDPTIEYVLKQIANDEEYPCIGEEFDRFIKILITSKHNETGELFKKFCRQMVARKLMRINLKRHDRECVAIILKNERWDHDPTLISIKKCYLEGKSFSTQ